MYRSLIAATTGALGSSSALLSESNQLLSSMLVQPRTGSWGTASVSTSAIASASSGPGEEGTIRRVPILESLFPGRGVSHKDIVPKNYEPPGGPVTDRVYMDLAIGDRPAGRIVFGLYGRYLPRTTKNFRALISGDNEEKRSYRGTLVHRVIRDLFLQGGDVLFNNGTGSWSVYGRAFPDESRDFLFSKAGLLAMANFNGQPHSNGSQWFVTLTPLEYLDRKAVVFGEVLEGFEVLREVNELETDLLDRPRPPVSVEDCGILEEDEE